MSDRRTNRLATLALAAPIFLLPGGHDLASGRFEPSEGVLRSLVEDFARAIEVNHLELALSYVHPSSPHRAEFASALREQLASHLERARTTDLECLRRPDGTLSATVDQELVRVFEMKFTRATRRSIYHFREHRGTWRIWGIDKVAPGTALARAD
jgi:hypothetical protein